MLQEKFDSLQKGMQIKFEEIRHEFEHRGSKGSNVEKIVRDFVSSYLPPHNRIGHGEIMDSFGGISNQVDVIVTNENHPYLNDFHEPSKFFIEGISCVGEVKSVITTDDIKETLNKCLNFKNLQIWNDAGTKAYCSYEEDLIRFVHKRPFFLFAFSSQLSLDTIWERIDAYNTENRIDLQHQIDAVFILDRGQIVNAGNGLGSIRIRSERFDILTGYVPFQIKEKPNILLDFMFWLHLVMPRIDFYQSILHRYLQ